MTNVKHILLGCLILCLGLYACGTQPTSSDGFLSDYSKLQKNPKYEGSRIYFNPDKPLKNYTRIIVNPVQVRLSSIGAHQGADPEKVQKNLPVRPSTIC